MIIRNPNKINLKAIKKVMKKKEKKKTKELNYAYETKK